MRKKKVVKNTRRAVKVGSHAAVTGTESAENVAEVPLVSVVPCPISTDPAMGDKTPEVMAWYREHWPEEYKRRYGNRVCPEVDEMVGGGVMESDDGGGPVSDFEDEDDERVVVKPRVIMG